MIIVFSQYNAAQANTSNKSVGPIRHGPRSVPSFRDRTATATSMRALAPAPTVTVTVAVAVAMAMAMVLDDATESERVRERVE